MRRMIVVGLGLLLRAVVRDPGADLAQPVRRRDQRARVRARASQRQDVGTIGGSSTCMPRRSRSSRWLAVGVRGVAPGSTISSWRPAWSPGLSRDRVRARTAGRACRGTCSRRAAVTVVLAAVGVGRLLSEPPSISRLAAWGAVALVVVSARASCRRRCPAPAPSTRICAPSGRARRRSTASATTRQARRRGAGCAHAASR